jgi:regulatory subunit for Cdc7p protein kinase
MADILGQGSQPQTINPLLLERSSELAATHSESYPPKGRFTFESVARKGSGAEYESRKQPGRSSDVLQKARELGMKIWALEKLQRMMNTMFETDTSMAYSHGHNTRSNSVQAGTVSRSTREADLSALLRHERINGPSDRDPTVATRELTLFKGPFIYVHDINEKQKPIMVREYAKVSNKEHGDWPQFRSVPHGKCPFVPEADYSKRDAERDVARQQRQLERERAVAAPRTRAAAAVQTRTQQGRADGQQGLTESASAGNRGAPAAVVKELDLFGRPVEQAADDSHFTKGPQNAFVSRAVGGRLLGGEPVASGLQHSNITSAIRSQMISSTAAAPGAKAGTSKEVHGLQRKVFEKNSGPTSLGLTSSHRMTDLNLIKDDASTKTLKRRNMETIDDEPQEAENVSRRHDEHKPTKAVSRKRASKREPKAGYCENCFDKFDDFEEVLFMSFLVGELC